MPMIGCTDDHALKIFILEQLAEIRIGPGRLTAGGNALFETWLVDIAHCSQIHVLLITQIMDMLAPNQAESNDSHLDTFVRAQNSAVRSSAYRAKRNRAPPRHASSRSIPRRSHWLV